jgi:hypothetical protein
MSAMFMQEKYGNMCRIALLIVARAVYWNFCLSLIIFTKFWFSLLNFSLKQA